MSESTPAISVQGLSVSYDKKRVLRNIYLEIQEGEIYGILGPNGAGKSTLFKAILQLIDINRGQIDVFGRSLEEVRKRVAYIPQKGEVDWDFPATVKDVVLMGRYPHKRFFQKIDAQDMQIAEDAMEYLGISALSERQIGGLSGGQQQRVFIARALTQRADLFLLDEPFVGVDITTENKIVQILQDLKAQHKTFLVIHHDLSKVEQYFDQVVLLNRRLISCGPVAQAFKPELIEATYNAPPDILLKT